MTDLEIEKLAAAIARHLVTEHRHDQKLANEEITESLALSLSTDIQNALEQIFERLMGTEN